MADAPNTLATLNGIFKEVYPEGVVDLVPNGTKFQQIVKFTPKQLQLGNKYHQPVRLALANGFTFAGASAGAFTLNDAAAGQSKDASLEGSQIVLKEQIDYESAARASSSKNAFVDATGFVLEGMQISMRKKMEVEYLYGSSGLATVASYNSGTKTITITTSEFAPGIWAGMEGMPVDVYNGASLIVADIVAAVDIDARTVTLTTGGSISAGYTLWFGGAKTNEMTGAYGILTNSGSLFGISAATYSLWKGTSYGAGSVALNFNLVKAAVARAVGKGLDEPVELFVNPKGWDNMLSDLASLRRYDKNDSTKYMLGADSIEFYSQNGPIKITPSIYIKEGHAFGFLVNSWKRLGAAELTFQTPGYQGEIFLQIPTKAGFELRAYSNSCVFCEKPAANFIITGIVNV